ncbi:MAG: pyruvate,orthophosphate dikinase [Bradymonadia bacterium]|jgi:pyruvate,orthophosphate dikinase
MIEPRIYSFGAGVADGAGDDKERLGGKGAGLAEMTRLGVPVPAGFTLTTAECLAFEEAGQSLSDGLLGEIDTAMALLESRMGAGFGDEANPLLVSVRSGARASMPGMMDTVLNVGLNDQTVQGLIEETGDRRFAYDSYRRFIQMFGNVVLGVDHYYFEEELHAVKREAGVREDHELGAEDWVALIPRYKAAVAKHGSAPFPETPKEQLLATIRAVFQSWHNERAAFYRDQHGIPHAWGTAVNVQAMVFGNLGQDCATGVAFTRDPATGAKVRYGEFLPNAQGEDVVAGIRTPQPLAGTEADCESLELMMPEAYAELMAIEDRLEAHYRDMQDIEFTIQRGKVWILQTRSGKRTTAAAVRIAVEMANEGLISRTEALHRVPARSLDELLHPAIDRDAEVDVLAQGLAASPGAATGAIVLSAEAAEAAAKRGEDVILVRAETTPEDIKGMTAAQGVLTSRGGITSHAAVVARQMGKCCVAGCSAVLVYHDRVRIGDVELAAGDIISLDGTRGLVIRGSAPRIAAQLTDEFETLMGWAAEARRLGVWANADSGHDATLARRFGAVGIGLARTEHMFFDGDRINAMREMILAANEPARRAALEKLRPFQTSDFVDILSVMDGLPVTVRLLDPPLHEFLPEREQDIEALARALNLSAAEVHHTVELLRESNPMLGHRGCRLGIAYPEIYEMQVRAIFDATLAVRDAGKTPMARIMVPLVSVAAELAAVRAIVERVRDSYGERAEELKDVAIGTMIELPRACLIAGDIARHADFLSFGTNDLTQTTFGFSRDDVAGFLPGYIAAGLLPHDPFVVLDSTGVGELVTMACERARAVKPSISIGICGEHGGEPRSVAWAHTQAIDYVSCSPFRVPVACLASAQAAAPK